jgi:predicted ester cyclase
MMSSEKNKLLVKRLFEGINQKGLEIYDQMTTPGFVWHGVIDQSRKEYRKDLGSVLSAFPDAKWEIHDLLCEDDKVIVRWTFFGTHTHPWGTLPATRKKIKYGGISIYRIEDEKIAEVWNNESLLSLYRQLGFNMKSPKRRIFSGRRKL